MPLFTRSDLQRKVVQKSLTRARANDSLIRLSNSDQQFDVFLSHSYLDAEEIQAIVLLFEEMGHSCYVDWLVDRSLDRSDVTTETAALIRRRMKQCKSLVYATSENSSDSKWMQWELGYFDGFRGKVAILPIVEDYEASGQFVGLEYLGLYPYVDKAPSKNDPSLKLWVQKLNGPSTQLGSWLTSGKVP